MELKTIKTAADLEEAINSFHLHEEERRPYVELIKVDGTVKGARVGNAVFTVESYSFVAHRQVQHIEETRYRLVAKVQGFDPVILYFREYDELAEKKKSFADTAELDDNGFSQVKVLVDARGNVFRDLEPSQALMADNVREKQDDALTF